MKTAEYRSGGFVFRWAGGSFIPVWTDTGREPDGVPTDMIELPAWLNRAEMNREVFEMISEMWLKGK